GECVNGNNMDESIKDYRYRKSECHSMCMQAYVMLRCGCIDSSLLYISDDIAGCNSSFPAGDQDILTKMENQFNESQYCRCRNINVENTREEFDIMSVHRKIDCSVAARTEAYE